MQFLGIDLLFRGDATRRLGVIQEAERLFQREHVALEKGARIALALDKHLVDANAGVAQLPGQQTGSTYERQRQYNTSTSHSHLLAGVVALRRVDDRGDLANHKVAAIPLCRRHTTQTEAKNAGGNPHN